ncbi:hypothetical protein C8Q77DRAFT_1160320 [Trametes polyzona]|nr:hypothetical protein C8Q77DRAFT_1160320 [Trametes polyzona]
MRVPRFVAPVARTVLRQQHLYRPHKNDLLINFTGDIAYAVPARLDIEGLASALSRTLASFPLFCGRLVRDPEWAISLDPPQPISFSVKEGSARAWWDAPETTAVIRRQPGPQVEKINPLRLLSGEDPALLKTTVVRMNDWTLVGMSCSHIVADLAFVVKFMRMWSQHYTRAALEPEPVYRNRADLALPADPARLAHIRSKLPGILSDTFALDDIPPSVFSPFPITRVDVRLSSAQTRALHAALGRLAQSSVSVGQQRLTAQDALSAFIVSAANASSNEPITQIHNVMNCRGINPDVLSAEAAGNGLMYATTERVALPPSRADAFVAYARAMRASIVEARDPAYVRDFLALSGEEWYGPAMAHRGHYVAPTPGKIIINSSWRHDWGAAHFGCPGRTCWQMSDTVPTDNYVLVSPSNPAPGGAGVWARDGGACEVSLNVRAGREAAFGAAVRDVWAELVGEGAGTPGVTVFL